MFTTTPEKLTLQKKANEIKQVHSYVKWEKEIRTTFTDTNNVSHSDFKHAELCSDLLTQNVANSFLNRIKNITSQKNVDAFFVTESRSQKDAYRIIVRLNDYKESTLNHPLTALKFNPCLKFIAEPSNQMINDAKNQANQQRWDHCSPEAKANLSTIFIFGNQDYYNKYPDTAKKLIDTIHFPGELPKTPSTDASVMHSNAALDCTQRIVVQSAFVNQQSEIIGNLMQATVVSACFRSYVSPIHPGGDFFINNWCNQSILNGRIAYFLTEQGKAEFKKQIYQTAKLYFLAIDKVGIHACTIPDVGGGAYLAELDPESKNTAVDIIKETWRSVAEELSNTNTLLNLKHILFTPVKGEEKQITINNVTIYNWPGFDNIKLAVELSTQFPNLKVAFTIAGAAQGLGGDYRGPRGSQEEGAFRFPGNISGPMLMESLANKSLSISHALIDVGSSPIPTPNQCNGENAKLDSENLVVMMVNPVSKEVKATVEISQTEIQDFIEVMQGTPSCIANSIFNRKNEEASLSQPKSMQPNI